MPFKALQVLILKDASVTFDLRACLKPSTQGLCRYPDYSLKLGSSEYRKATDAHVLLTLMHFELLLCVVIRIHHHHHHNSLIQVDRRNSVQKRVRIQYIYN